MDRTGRLNDIISGGKNKCLVLLFDEPTSGLDHKHMKAVGSLLRSLAERGKTVIVSTHDPELIAVCCQYLLCLEKGRIKYIREV